MPDGNQGPFTYKPPQPQNISPQPFNIPGATKPAGGVERAISLVRTLTLSSVGLAMFVFGLQAAMPEGSKPSDLMGSLHGATESAEIKAKQEAAVEFQRRMSDAQAAPPANWQIEQMTAQAQLQERAKSLGAQEEAAQIADLACIGSGLVTGIFGDTRDSRAWRDAMKQGCAIGEGIRDNINDTLARGTRQGSGVVQRSNPGTGAGSAPSFPGAAHSR
jgi:hypothetical protein